MDIDWIKRAEPLDPDPVYTKRYAVATAAKDGKSGANMRQRKHFHMENKKPRLRQMQAITITITRLLAACLWCFTYFFTPRHHPSDNDSKTMPSPRVPSPSHACISHDIAVLSVHACLPILVVSLDPRTPCRCLFCAIALPADWSVFQSSLAPTEAV